MTKIAHLIHNNQSQLLKEWIKLNSIYTNHPQQQIALIDIDLSKKENQQVVHEMCNYYGVKFDDVVITNQPMVIVSSDKNVNCIKGNNKTIISKFVEQYPH